MLTSGAVYEIPADWDQAYIEFNDRADQSRKVTRIYVNNEPLDDPDDKVPKQFSGHGFRLSSEAGVIKCTVVLDIIDNSNAYWKRNGSLTIPVPILFRVWR